MVMFAGLLAVMGAWGAPAATAAAVPADMPDVLVAVSMDANWVAPGAGSWRECGVGGFLFNVSGAGLSRSVWALDGNVDTIDSEDGTLAVFRRCQQALAAAAITRNFLVIPLTPEGPYFLPGPPSDTAAERLREAAQLCRMAGLRGVALDTQPSSLFYDFRWDGYGYEGYSPEDLLAGAARLGRRMGHALFHELPDSELLVLADGGVSWGPLWASLLGGLTESLTASPGASIHILLKHGPGVAADAVRVAESLEAARARLAIQLTPESGVIWDKRGYLAAGFDPFRAGSRAAYASQLTAALTCSGRYCWLDARDWKSDASAASWPDDFTQPPARGRLASFQRVGALLEEGVPSFVFLSDAGASVLFPHGLPEGMQLDAEGDKVRVLNIDTDELRGVDAANGVVPVGPARGMVLVEGLPVRRWALPAALWADAGHAPEAGQDGVAAVSLRYGFEARQALALTGSLDVKVPEGCTIVPPSVPISLQPGEAIEAEAVVRGPLRAGSVLELQLSLVLPGSPPVVRDYAFPVSPAQRWQYALDGPLSGPPIAAVLGEDGVVIIAATVTGQLASLNAGGGLRWTRRFDAVFTGSPAVGRAPFGQSFVVVADTLGRIRAVDVRGNAIWETPLGGPALLPGPVCLPLDDVPGDDVCVGLQNGAVAALSTSGKELWKESALTEGDGHLAVLPLGALPAESIVAVRGGRVPSIVCHGRKGTIRWQKRLEAEPVAAPFLFEMEGGKLPEIMAPLGNGAVAGWDAVSGDAAGTNMLDIQTSMQSFGAIESKGAFAFAAATADSIVGFDAAMQRAWQQPGKAVSLRAAPGPAGGVRWLAGYADGAVACLDGKGNALWIDHHGAGPLAAAPVPAWLDGPEAAPAVLVADATRFLRALNLE